MTSTSVYFVFGDESNDETHQLGRILVQTEQVSNKSPFLAELMKNSSDPENIFVSVQNFKNQQDVVAFLTTVFFVNDSSCFLFWNPDWLEYALFYQINDVCKVYIKQAGEHIQKVLSHYTPSATEELKEVMYKSSNGAAQPFVISPPNTVQYGAYNHNSQSISSTTANDINKIDGKIVCEKKKCEKNIWALPTAELSKFWQIVDMSFKHDALRHLVSGEFSKQLSKCPLLLDDNLKYVGQTTLIEIIKLLKVYIPKVI